MLPVKLLNIGLNMNLPRAGEAIPEPLTVTPEEAVEDAVEKAIKAKALHVRFIPDALQNLADAGTDDVQNLQAKTE